MLKLKLTVLLLLLVAGEDVTVDMEKNVLINHTTGKEYQLKPLGDVSTKLELLALDLLFMANAAASEQHNMQMLCRV